MKGHIQLGAPGDLRPYLLVEPRNYRAMTANPMAARVSTGSQYGDLQAWSTFLMADWQAGVGKTQAEAGGYLFGELDSRVPNQLILPAGLGCSVIAYLSGSAEHFYMPAEADAFVSLAVGGTGNPARVSITTMLPGTGEANLAARVVGMWFFGLVPDGIEVTAAFCSDSSGAPNAVLGSGTATFSSDGRPNYRWYYVPLSSEYRPTLVGAQDYHWVVYPSDSSNEIALVCGDTYAGGTSHTYNGTTWSALTAGRCPFFIWLEPTFAVSTVKLRNTQRFFLSTVDETLRSVAYSETTSGSTAAGVYRMSYSDSTRRWTPTLITTSLPAVPLDNLGESALFDGVVFIPRFSSGYSTWTLSTNATAANNSDAATSFCAWAGYLWRAYNNQLWYSADGSVWTAVSNDVGTSDYQIRGMAGFGQYLYVATDEALYYVAPGDTVVGLFPWSTIDERNGRGMVVHQGALYIPVAGRILRYAEDGSLQDIWINRDDDFNNQRLGTIAALAGLSNWLVAGVNGTTDTDPASVWAYTQQGWHHLATLPPGFTIATLYYDRSLSRLWIGSRQSINFYIHAPDWALNPYNDSDSVFMPHGWLETGRIYSGLRELRKDWESVRGFGEFTVGETDAVVYWKDADTDTWTQLGVVTEDGEELRWSDYDTRPNGRWLKLGLLLRTDTAASTPKIEAVATKLLPMVTDRRAWQLAITVSDDQEMVDGAQNPYTAAEMLAHLRGLVEQVPPFIFEDPAGAQYEVKATASAENIAQYEWLDASQETRIMWVVEMGIEQVTVGTYS